MFDRKQQITDSVGKKLESSGKGKRLKQSAK